MGQFQPVLTDGNRPRPIAFSTKGGSRHHLRSDSSVVDLQEPFHCYHLVITGHQSRGFEVWLYH